MLARKATAVMTNVPGPSEPISLAGSSVSRIMFWVPQSGDIGMGVSILSYNGGVQFGLITDAGLVPDPQTVIDFFEPEFDRLVQTLAMVPPQAFMAGELSARDIEAQLFG
jgi:diacylglycerol O-acyltransferase / wax synthase